MSKGSKKEELKKTSKKYRTSKKFYTKALNVNVEIVRHRTDLNKKRDKHCLHIQNSIYRTKIKKGDNYWLSRETKGFRMWLPDVGPLGSIY